jgi:hypothetical protein
MSEISDWCDQPMKPTGTFFIPKASPAQKALIKKLISPERIILLPRSTRGKIAWVKGSGFDDHTALIKKIMPSDRPA